MAKGTTLEHAGTERSSGAAQRDGIHLSEDICRKTSESRWLPASSLSTFEAAAGRFSASTRSRSTGRSRNTAGWTQPGLELMRDGSIDVRGFDGLMERLLTEDGTFVIDNGASTFIPLWSYIVDNQVIDILRPAAKRLYVHTVITGGQALLDTVNGFRSLAQSTTDRNVIVWINEYFGRVERDGKTFPNMTAYVENSDKVLGSVHIPKRNPDTFGRDVEDIISRKLTFEEAIANGVFSIMTKQRLRVVQRDLFEQLDAIEV